MRDGAADVVIANISAPVLEILAADLHRVTRPEGILILAGFIQDKMPAGFAPERIFEKNGWLCWICRPSATHPVPEQQQARIRQFVENWW